MYMRFDTDFLKLLSIVIAKGYVEPLTLSEREEKLLGSSSEEVKNNYTVSQNIRIFRSRNNMTQRDLAKALGTSNAYIYYYEKRHRIIPVRLYPHIAKVLGVTVDELLKEE